MSYISEAVDLIRSLNSNDSVLSPHDYMIISEWEKQEIPLALVLASLREYFSIQKDLSEGSLMALRDEIRNRYAAWLRNINPVSIQQDSKRRVS